MTTLVGCFLLPTHYSLVSAATSRQTVAVPASAVVTASANTLGFDFWVYRTCGLLGTCTFQTESSPVITFGKDTAYISNPALVPLRTAFQMADQFIVIRNNYNGSFMLRVYSDNTKATAVPRFNPPGTSDYAAGSYCEPVNGTIICNSGSTPAGLLALPTDTSVSGTRSVAVAWKASPYFVNKTADPGPYHFPFMVVPLTFNCHPELGDTQTTKPNDCLNRGTEYDWFMMKDKANTDSYEALLARGVAAQSAQAQNALDYTVIANDQGIHTSQGNNYSAPLYRLDYAALFMAIESAGLRTPEFYKSNQITLELSAI